jgi:hypothetical protein
LTQQKQLQKKPEFENYLEFEKKKESTLEFFLLLLFFFSSKKKFGLVN